MAQNDERDEIRLKYPISQNERDFIEWLVTPEAERQPRYAKEWAAERGVHEKTPQAWKRDRWFRAAWDMRLQQLNINPDRVQKLVDAIYDKALKGDVQAQKLYLEYAKGFMPQQRIEVVRPASELSDEELALEMEKAIIDLRGKA
jgi:hypothetical protein